MADFDEFFEAAKVDSKSSSLDDTVGKDGPPNPNFMTPMGSKSLDPAENEKIIDEIREWVKRSTSRDKTKHTNSKSKNPTPAGKTTKKSGKKKASASVDVEETPAKPIMEELPAEKVESLAADVEISKSRDHLIFDSQLSHEHFYEISLRDAKMRELNLSSDSADTLSAADRILAVKNSLKKTAIVDPYSLNAPSKEMEEKGKDDDDEDEDMTAEEIKLMESIPFSYRTYDELVHLNMTKSYAGLMQKKLEAYLTDEDFQIVFRKDRESFYAQPLWKQKSQKRNVKLF
mmetsp:Transcript_12092/g.16601  ORF Transcript_12092/g.16601 Transcript_12092/m.16601 type:complete len:288 (+) Transcript_12092:17-880(+)